MPPRHPSPEPGEGNAERSGARERERTCRVATFAPRGHIATVITAARPAPTGIALAAAVAAAWATIHIGGLFVWRLGWWSAPLILAQAWLSTGLFIVAHDAMHGSLAPGRARVNLWAGRIALRLYAMLSFDTLRRAHFEHHRRPGSDTDPDFHPGHPRAFVPWLIRFFGGYYTHLMLALITVRIWVYIALGAAPSHIVLFWGVPSVLAVFQLFYFGTFLPHRHAEDIFTDRHNARSNAMGRWAAVASCFNFGAYHHEHHLFPDTPWWRLPARRQRGADLVGS